MLPELDDFDIDKITEVVNGIYDSDDITEDVSKSIFVLLSMGAILATERSMAISSSSPDTFSGLAVKNACDLAGSDNIPSIRLRKVGDRAQVVVNLRLFYLPA